MTNPEKYTIITLNSGIRIQSIFYGEINAKSHIKPGKAVHFMAINSFYGLFTPGQFCQHCLFYRRNFFCRMSSVSDGQSVYEWTVSFDGSASVLLAESDRSSGQDSYEDFNRNSCFLCNRRKHIVDRGKPYLSGGRSEGSFLGVMADFPEQFFVF